MTDPQRIRVVFRPVSDTGEPLRSTHRDSMPLEATWMELQALTTALERGRWEEGAKPILFFEYDGSDRGPRLVVEYKAE